MALILGPWVWALELHSIQHECRVTNTSFEAVSVLFPWVDSYKNEHDNNKWTIEGTQLYVWK